ncbi:MAG: amidohydrolase family protein [Thermodesulfobacteriota bacterium]
MTRQEQLTGHPQNNRKLGGVSRRQFLKMTALASAGLAIGAAGPIGLTGCGGTSDWKSLTFDQVLFHNLRLFDGVKNRLQPGLMLLIQKDGIKAIEPLGDLAQFRDYKKVDLKGQTVMPGLIDNHVHMTVPFMYDVNLTVLRQMDEAIRLNFRNCVLSGVTTVRDVGGFPGKIKKYRQMADALEIPGPRVISSLSPIAARQGDALGAPEKAPYFTNPVMKWALGGNYAERPTNLEEIKEAGQRMIALGAQWLKTLHQDHSYSYFPRTLPNHGDEGYRAILKMGADHGLKCALHEPLLSGFKKGVELGFHTLEHMPLDGIIPDELIDGFIKKNMAMMPTLMAYGDVFAEEKILKLIKEKGEVFLVPEAIRQMTAKLEESLDQAKKKMTDQEHRDLIFDRQYLVNMFPNQVANLVKLHRAGAAVGVGTDNGGTYSGFFGRYREELRYYQAAGLSNYDILRMATAVNASILGMSDRLGSIEKGKLADIIAVPGNPLEDLAVLSDVRLVMKGGVFMKAEGLGL